MTLSDFVKEYRKEHDLSQRQFAAICGLSNGYISMLERNLNPKTGLPLTPSLPALKKISTAMGMSLGDLLTAVDDMPIDLLSDISEDCANELSALTKEGGPMDDMDIAAYDAYSPTFSREESGGSSLSSVPRQPARRLIASLFLSWASFSTIRSIAAASLLEGI